MIRRSLLEFAGGGTVRWRRAAWVGFWLLGLFVTNVVEEVLNFAALFYAPAALVAPVAGIHVAFAVLLSSWWLKEPVSARGMTCIVVCMVAVGFCSLAAPKTSTDHSVILDELEDLFVAASKIAFISIIACLIIVLYCFALLPTLQRTFGLVQSLAPPVLAGTFGGLVQLTNHIMVLILVALEERGLFSVIDDPACMGVIFSHGLLILLGVYWFNQSLKGLPAAVVVPVSNCVYLYTAGVGSTTLFSETPANSPLYFTALGVIIISTGMFFLYESQLTPADSHGPLTTTDASLHVVDSLRQKLFQHCFSVLPGHNFYRTTTFRWDESTSPASNAVRTAPARDAEFSDVDLHDESELGVDATSWASVVDVAH